MAEGTSWSWSWTLLVLLSLPGCPWSGSGVSAIQRADLFPYGPMSGDLPLAEGDDETSRVLALPRPLYFYQSQFSELYVSISSLWWGDITTSWIGMLDGRGRMDYITLRMFLESAFMHNVQLYESEEV